MRTIHLHPHDPQPRFLKQITQALNDGKIIAYPTDIGYALLTHINSKDALGKMTKIPCVKQKSQYVLICQSISNASNYATINNEQFRTIKNSKKDMQFILPSNKQTPKHLINQKNKKIGIYITKNKHMSFLLEMVGNVLVMHEFDDAIIESSVLCYIEDQLNQQIDFFANIGTIDNIKTQDLDLTKL